MFDIEDLEVGAHFCFGQWSSEESYSVLGDEGFGVCSVRICRFRVGEEFVEGVLVLVYDCIDYFYGRGSVVFVVGGGQVVVFVGWDRVGGTVGWEVVVYVIVFVEGLVHDCLVLSVG